ncbi:MAG: M18 family aminopeptidase [Planctomycetota bacterium]
MTSPTLEEARGLLSFLDASPSPFHAVAAVARRLEAAGFRPVAEAEPWGEVAGRRYAVRGASLVAWVLAGDEAPGTGFRIVGAHTDSPTLRIKPRPDARREGLRQLGVEVYGSALVNSWLDRDLGVAGRVWLRAEEAPAARTFHLARPLLRIPQLAIHLDRDVREKGLLLNAQQHLAPIWGIDDGTERGFRALLGRELAVDPAAILSWDAVLCDTAPSTLLGADEEFVSGPRLDDLCSCYCGLRALVRRAEAGGRGAFIPVLCLFDHEEVGSTSARGAASPLLEAILERIVLTRGGGREDYHRSTVASVCASADMAHATNPNYADRHEPDHHLELNKGPVIKINANLRYATDGETEALFAAACETAGVPYQKFVNRTDLACGTTIGPITAGRLGIRTVDVGNPELAMHSIRELCGAHDPEYMIRALVAFHG